ncbi:MAG: hypothetical protein ACR2K2_09085 [Mycobacteriales bacterium]
MTTLLRDVLIIPERAGAEDDVLRLTDSVGVASAARTLDDYVVTPALADAFDAATVGNDVSARPAQHNGVFCAGHERRLVLTSDKEDARTSCPGLPYVHSIGVRPKQLLVTERPRRAPALPVTAFFELHEGGGGQVFVLRGDLTTSAATPSWCLPTRAGTSSRHTWAGLLPADRLSDVSRRGWARSGAAR